MTTTFNGKQLGFSLIQLMIALAIGLFLLSGVIQVFLGARQSYRVNEAFSRMQENVRFALERIGRDIRMADYRACPTDRRWSLYQMAAGTPQTMASTAGVYGKDGANNQPDSLNLNWTLQNCGAANPLESRIYTVDSSGSQPYLMRNGSQLIEGVENMQITYGVNTDDYTGDPARTPNYYVTATNVPNWNEVTSIRVSLLLRTLDDRVASNKLAYTYDARTINPDDHRIRRVFTATFAVRNRLPT